MGSGLPRSGPLEEDCSLQNKDTSEPCGGKIGDIERLDPAKPALALTPEQGGHRTSFWSALERSVWMNRPGWVVHKRAFVTLGHKSLPSTCPGVGHKGIVRSAPVGGVTVDEKLSEIAEMVFTHSISGASFTKSSWRCSHFAEGETGERDLRDERDWPFHPGDR